MDMWCLENQNLRPGKTNTLITLFIDELSSTTNLPSGRYCSQLLLCDAARDQPH